MSQSIFDRELEQYLHDNFVDFPSDLYPTYTEEYEITDSHIGYDLNMWVSGWYTVSVKPKSPIGDLAEVFLDALDQSGDYRAIEGYFLQSVNFDGALVVAYEWVFELKFKEEGAEDFQPFDKYSDINLFDVEFNEESTNINHLSNKDIDLLIDTLDVINTITEEEVGDDGDWSNFCQDHADEYVGDTKKEILEGYKYYLES